MGKSSIQSLLKNLPSTPGVYRFKNDEGTVLYVGKAKNLKNRVRSYFQKQNNRPIRTQKLIEKTIDLEWTEVGSDIEAIFLETNLIKELRPKYNVLMKDDKNWVYIKITKDELFPRIKIVRKVENDKARYFGPSTAAGKLKKTLLLLQKLFMYRTCDLGIDWRNDEAKITKKTIAFPCLDYHIKRCAGPCISKISPEEYGESIRKIELFLEGKTSEIEGKLKKQMADCVAKKAYEKAGILRDKLQAIDGLIQKQLVTSADHSTMDVLAFTLNEGKAYFTLFALRDGKLLKQENFVLSASGFESGDEDMAPEVLETFLFQYYSKAADIPPQIFVPAGLPEMDLFHDWIKDRAGKVVKLKTPQKGKKHKLLDLAKKNALSFQKQQIARWAGFEEDDMESLEELARVLEMKKKPKRIEAYDISHLGGTDTVASMVVFENGKSKKSDYRKFRLRTLEEGEIDDFKSMTEILKRRLRYISVLPKGVTVRKATKSRTKDIDELRGEWHDVESDVGETFSEYFVAFFEKKVVGIMRMTPGKDGKFLMRSLYVKHEHRGSGIAYGLMAYASKKLKAKRVYLSCFDHMKDFYENFGFDLVKSIPKEFTDLYLDVLIAENPDENMNFYAFDPKKNYDASFKTKPDLLLIDGGKGQLSSAKKALDYFGLEIPMISLAKREEEIFLPGKSLPLLIPVDSKASKLLQRLRNEAHRFAISFQKKSRKKHLTSSVLDKIDGLGEKMKLKLLKEFTSPKQVFLASEESLAAIVGPKLAKAIKSYEA